MAQKSPNDILLELERDWAALAKKVATAQQIWQADGVDIPEELLEDCASITGTNPFSDYTLVAAPSVKEPSPPAAATTATETSPNNVDEMVRQSEEAFLAKVASGEIKLEKSSTQERLEQLGVRLPSEDPSVDPTATLFQIIPNGKIWRAPRERPPCPVSVAMRDRAEADGGGPIVRGEVRVAAGGDTDIGEGGIKEGERGRDRGRPG